jgi:hypothetical protein
MESIITEDSFHWREHGLMKAATMIVDRIDFVTLLQLQINFSVADANKSPFTSSCSNFRDIKMIDTTNNWTKLHHTHKPCFRDIFTILLLDLYAIVHSENPHSFVLISVVVCM